LGAWGAGGMIAAIPASIRFEKGNLEGVAQA